MSARASRRTWIWYAATLALSAWLLLPTLRHGFGWDHGYIQYVAWAWTQGLWPYIDTWDGTYPGAFLLHLLLFHLGGHTPVAIHTLDLVVQLSVAGMMVYLGDRLGSARAGLLAALLYVAFYAQNPPQFTASRDGMLVLPMLILLASLWSYWDRPRRWVLVSVGFLWGLACLIRPTYALLAATGALAILLVPTARHWRTRLLDGVLLGASSAVPLLLFYALYLAMGAGEVLRDHWELISGVYAQNGRFPSLYMLYLIYDLAPVAFVFGTVWSLFTLASGPNRLRQASLLGLLVLCIAVRLVEGKAFVYQLFPVFAAMALLAGVGLNKAVVSLVRRAEEEGVRRPLLVPLSALAFLVLFAGSVGPFRGILTAKPANPDPDVQLLCTTPAQAPVARYLREQTPPQSRIQGWGVAPGLYYAARRLAASRFIDFNVFLCDVGPLIGGPMPARIVDDCTGPSRSAVQEKFAEEYLREVRKADYIVAHYRPGSIAVTVEIAQVPDFPRLREILEREYESEAVFGQWTVFRRRADVPDAAAPRATVFPPRTDRQAAPQP